MFWLLCALLTLAVAVAIAAPLWQARSAPSAASFDLQVYRDQLREVERDLERGVIGADDAERLRAEIGRKVLDADKRAAASAPVVSQRKQAGALVILAITMVGGIALYLWEGAPDRPDLPLSKRIALAEQSYQSRPSQAEAEAAIPEINAPEVEQSYLDLVAQLREKVAERPNDPQGLALLATHEMRLGNMQAAREAQQKLVELRGDDASAEDLIRLVTVMFSAAGGVITPEAEDVLAQALDKQPNLPQGRYLAGLLQLQNGRADRAFPIWRDLLAEGPRDAPWNQLILAANIQDIAWIAGHPEYVLPEEEPLPGPDAQTMQAAEDMAPAERAEFIEGMVAQLETRLANEGGSAEEWARLISSLGVLGRTDKAQAIYDEAKQRFGAKPDAMAPIEAAAEQAGLVR